MSGAQANKAGGQAAAGTPRMPVGTAGPDTAPPQLLKQQISQALEVVSSGAQPRHGAASGGYSPKDSPAPRAHPAAASGLPRLRLCPGSTRLPAPGGARPLGAPGLGPHSLRCHARPLAWQIEPPTIAHHETRCMDLACPEMLHVAPAHPRLAHIDLSSPRNVPHVDLLPQYPIPHMQLCSPRTPGTATPSWTLFSQDTWQSHSPIWGTTLGTLHVPTPSHQHHPDPGLLTSPTHP